MRIAGCMNRPPAIDDNPLIYIGFFIDQELAQDLLCIPQ